MVLDDFGEMAICKRLGQALITPHVNSDYRPMSNPIIAQPLTSTCFCKLKTHPVHAAHFGKRHHHSRIKITNRFTAYVNIEVITTKIRR